MLTNNGIAHVRYPNESTPLVGFQEFGRRLADTLYASRATYNVKGR